MEVVTVTTGGESADGGATDGTTGVRSTIMNFDSIW